MREGHLTSSDEPGVAGKWRYREEQETPGQPHSPSREPTLYIMQQADMAVAVPRICFKLPSPCSHAE